MYNYNITYGQKATRIKMPLCFLCFVMFFIAQDTYSSNFQADSLVNALRFSNPNEKLIIYKNLFNIYKDNDAEKALEYVKEGYELSEFLTNDTAKALFLNYFALYHQLTGNLENSLLNFKEAIRILEKTDNKALRADVYNNLGNTYARFGENEKAIKYFFDALSIFESLKKLHGVSDILNNIALIYLDQKEYKKALQYFLRSNEIIVKLKDQNDLATSFNNIGTAYYFLENYDSVLINYTKALNIYHNISNKRGESVCLFNIGEVYADQGKYDLALHYIERALQINVSLGDIEQTAYCYNILGKIYHDIDNSAKALEYLHKAEEMTRDMGIQSDLYNIYKNISDIYTDRGDYKNALDYYVKFSNLGDSIFNLEKNKQLQEIESKYQNEKKQDQIEQQQLLLVQKELEVRQQTIQKLAYLVGFLLLLVISIAVLRNNRIKKEANEKLEEQNRQIEHQKNKITDSIEYAKIIQSAALPPYEYMKKVLPEHFILFLPRDIVSGDFFWVTSKDDKIVIAAADCTGHGVPGAFMSMLGISFLTEIVNRIDKLESDIILNILRKNIIESLHQTGKIGESRDGMDIALCILDKKYNEMQYSGAFNPLVIVRDDNLIQVAADKMPIGMHDDTQEPFTRHNVKLLKNDMVYLFTDGYADQFGGEFNKKFKVQPFLSLLLANYQKPARQQKEILYDTILNWKGNIDQIDDILVMGFRI